MKLTKTEKNQINEKRKNELKQLQNCKKQYINQGNPIADIVKFIKYIMKNTTISQRRLNEIMGQESTGFTANLISGKKRLTNCHAVNLANACNMSIGEKVKFYESVLNG